jgi:TRAP-type uncharacterized transport system substrate-binding protein
MQDNRTPLRVRLARIAVWIAASLTAMMAAQASAQQLKVATGGKGNTYSTMFQQASKLCAETGLALIEENTSGSMQNMDLLIGNQINAALVQTDVLFYRARTEDIGNIKTLVAFHPEEVHLIAKARSGIEEGGRIGTSWGAKEVVFNSISDLAGRRVGAWGGSVITAQVIRLQSEIPFEVVEFASEPLAYEALSKGTVQAILAVGGSPLGHVAKLDSFSKLLSIPDAIQAKLKGVYRPAKLNYSKMGTAGMGVQTVATDALFVTREYKTPKYVEGLGKLRACILNNLDELKEATGTHPKWQSVDANNKGKWAWYELPSVNQPKTAVVKPVKK